jgi:anti-anti-sigma factor
MDSPHRDRDRALAAPLDRWILEETLGQFPAAVIVAEAPSGKLILVNAQAERMWRRGFHPADTVDAYWQSQGFHPDGRPMDPDEQPLVRAIRTGEVVGRQEILIRRGDGTNAVIEAHAAPIRDRNGTIVAGAVYFLDVTNQRHAEMRGDRLARQKHLLLEISTDLCTHRSVRPACQAIARHCTRVLGDWCAVELIEPGCQCLKAAAIHHRDRRQVARIKRALVDLLPRRRDPLIAWALEQRRPVIVTPDAPGVRDLVEGTPAAEVFMRLGIRAGLLAPAYAGAEPLGLLCIGADAGTHWDVEDLHLAALIADRAGVVIHGARLSEAERAARETAERAADRFARLHQLVVALAKATTTAAAIDAVLDQGLAVAGAQAGMVALLAAGPATDAAGGVAILELAGATGYLPGVIDRWRRFPVSTSVPVADAVRTGAPVWVESPEALGARYPRQPSPPSGQSHRAWAALPLGVHGRTIGAVLLAFVEPRAFDDEDRRLMLTLAHECAQALERTRLHEAQTAAWRAAERSAERSARLHAITAALSEAVHTDQVARVSVDQGMLATNARAAGIALFGAEDAALRIVHTSGVPEELAGRWRRHAVSARSMLADAAKTERPLFFETQAALLSHYPHLADTYARLAIEAAAVLPLSIERHALGVLFFTFAEPRAFDGEERSLLLTLARQCAQALERVRLYEREHRIAEALQQVFLPAGVPQVPGVEIDAVHVPGADEAAIGGDWYDVFDMPDGRVAVSIGDVVGHGLQAAAIMGQVRQAIRVLAAEGHDPAAVVERAGRQLAMIHRAEKMATVIFGVLDPVSLSLTYASSGHPGPLLAPPDGRVEMLPSGGLPLGIDHTVVAPSWTVVLPRGALLVLYTDGLIEATRNVTEGQAALSAAVREVLGDAPAHAARAIRDRVLGRRRAPDDVAIVTVTVAPVPLERLALSVPAESSSLLRVRRSIRRLARDLGLPEDRTFALQVALGEALNNAIEHAYGAGAGTIDVRAWREGCVLTVEVEDHGRWRPERVEGRGFGLLIMRSLTDAMDVVRELSRTVVRLSVAISEHPAEPAESSATGGPVPEPRSDTGQQTGDDNMETSFGGPVQDRQFKIRLVDDVPVLDVACDVDLTNAARLEAMLEQAARVDRRAVVLALVGASYFDSQGTHALFRFGKRLAIHRQRLLIVAPAGHSIRSVLATTGVAESFPVLDSVEDAVSMARRDG